MTYPMLSDYIQSVGGFTSSDYNANNQQTVDFLTTNYDAQFGTVTADSFVGIPTSDFSATAGEAITAGNAVRISSADGKLYKASNSTISGLQNYVGIANDTVASESTLNVSTLSYSSLTGLTPGALYYISTSGGISTSTPTTFYQIAGVAISSTELLISKPNVQQVLSGASTATVLSSLAVNTDLNVTGVTNPSGGIASSTYYNKSFTSVVVSDSSTTILTLVATGIGCAVDVSLVGYVSQTSGGSFKPGTIKFTAIYTTSWTISTPTVTGGGRQLSATSSGTSLYIQWAKEDGGPSVSCICTYSIIGQRIASITT